MCYQKFNYQKYAEQKFYGIRGFGNIFRMWLLIISFIPISWLIIHCNMSIIIQHTPYVLADYVFPLLRWF